MENTKGNQNNDEEDTEKNNKIEKPIINSQQNIIHLRNNTKKKAHLYIQIQKFMKI